MPFSIINFDNLQQNKFNKPTQQRQYCIYNQPKTTSVISPTYSTTKLYSMSNNKINKNSIPVKYSNIYNQGKIKANSPNMSKKMEYAAFARRFGSTDVIGPC